MATEAVKITYIEAAAPSTPAASRVVMYAKADGLMYSKDDAGVETLVSSGATGSVSTDGIWDAAGDLAVGTGANTAAKLAISSTDGFVLASNGTTAVWEKAKTLTSFVRRNGANYTLNNNSTFTSIDGTNLKLTVAAVSGDVPEVSLISRYGNEAVNAFIDAATFVSAAAVNYVSGGTGTSGNFGVAGWVGLSGVAQSFGGSAFYAVQSGDISGGNVEVRLVYRTSAASNKTLNAGGSSADALFFAVKNLGQ